MNKKLFSILFILFLAGILSVSCSNKDKTGSGGNVKIDTTYKGNWYIADSQYLFMTVKDDGDVSFPGIESQGATGKKVEGSGSSYTATLSGPGAPDLVLQITFTDSSTGTVKISQGGNDLGTDNIVKR